MRSKYSRDGDENGTIEYTQENTYNCEGQRISKTDYGVKTCYYYQGSELLNTTDSNGNKTSTIRGVLRLLHTIHI